MNVKNYLSYLSYKGSCLGDISKKESNQITNITFKDDPSYKRVYILTKEGWKWEDAKFQKHGAISINADEIDYYIQFRPGIKYPIGSYVIIPDEDIEINLTQNEILNPFSQPVEERTQWWMIVNQTDTNMFKRYSVLKCNWNFKWIYDGKIQECFGCVRNANSYTSGKWTDEYSSSLDSLNKMWLPDIYYIYGEKYKELSLCDNRTITHEMRFFITTNTLIPDLYIVTKVDTALPKGLIKYTLKEDDYNEKRDNVDLMIADYYNDSGQPNIKVEENKDNIEENKFSQIFTMEVSSVGILEISHLTDIAIPEIIEIGKTSYYSVHFSDENIDPLWRIELISDVSNTGKEPSYYENLLKITEFDDTTIALRPSKASSLKGLQFKLIVSDINKDYESYALLEVGS
mgnify:FL=1